MGGAASLGSVSPRDDSVRKMRSARGGMGALQGGRRRGVRAAAVSEGPQPSGGARTRRAQAVGTVGGRPHRPGARTRRARVQAVGRRAAARAGGFGEEGERTRLRNCSRAQRHSLGLQTAAG